ncbi:CaiB/BaiF CoA transferase family protein [Cryptosporangium aurantiacum]
MGPGPHAALLLGDLGADVLRVERPGTGERRSGPPPRSRAVCELDLGHAAGRGTVLDLVAHADVLVEGFRPGVTERLGVGPAHCLARNPGLIYARMTGWGQYGPLAHRAGHDINYVGLTGVLDAIGRDGAPPTVPLNLVGDFGGGSTYLVIGILAALVERARSGRGQVIDAAIVDGVSSLAQAIWSLRGTGCWQDGRGTNRLDGGAPFYDVYPTADGGHMAVGALEPQFYAALLAGLGLDPAELPAQDDRSGWPALRAAFADAFRSRTRDEWTAVFANVDACVTPVLTFAEAAADPHLTARRTLVDRDGVVQPAPAPRFSRTPPAPPHPHPGPADPAAVLAAWAGSAPQSASPR